MQGRADVSARAVDGDIPPGWLGLLELKELSPAIVAVCATATASSAAFTLWLGFQMLPLNIQKQELDIRKGQREESEKLELEKNDENVRARRHETFAVGAACSLALLISQVLAAIGKGNTAPVDSEQFIRREAPLTDIVRILRAERAEQGFTYVVAGALHLQWVADPRCVCTVWYSASLIRPSAGPKAAGKTTLALMACGEVSKVRSTCHFSD